MTPQDRATLTINETYADEYVRPHMTPPKVAAALADAGLLAPDLPGPSGYNAGLPWWGACDTEVRPAGYEHRIICTDENGPWETSAADAREFAYALLAAADYAERIQS